MAASSESEPESVEKSPILEEKGDNGFAPKTSLLTRRGSIIHFLQVVLQLVPVKPNTKCYTFQLRTGDQTINAKGDFMHFFDEFGSKQAREYVNPHYLTSPCTRKLCSELERRLAPLFLPIYTDEKEFLDAKDYIEVKVETLMVFWYMRLFKHPRDINIGEKLFSIGPKRYNKTLTELAGLDIPRFFGLPDSTKDLFRQVSLQRIWMIVSGTFFMYEGPSLSQEILYVENNSCFHETMELYAPGTEMKQFMTEDTNIVAIGANDLRYVAVKVLPLVRYPLDALFCQRGNSWDINQGHPPFSSI